jgi:SAM-dependent methyltransferase
LWSYQEPKFDLVGWVLDLAGVTAGRRVADVGCGNGDYLRALGARGIDAVGCDLSTGMLAAAPSDALRVNGDAQALPFTDASFDVVLAPHMLYHVPDRRRAARELRRVLRPGGTCVVVTNGAAHMRSMRDLVETAARRGTPTWEMRNPATHAFSLENGAAQLAVAFDEVRCDRPDAAPVRLTDADVVAEYVASVADHYEHEVARPWSEIVAEVRAAVQQRIDRDGWFEVRSDAGAFVCR